MAVWTSPEFLRRLGITLAALLVFLAAQHVPLYGIDVTQFGLGPGSSGTLSRFSAGALGIVPIVTALAFAELLRLLTPWSWGVKENSQRKSVGNWALWLALALAAMQAAGILTAFESMPNVVTAAGWGFRAAGIASLLGATALFWWLANIITRHGLGSGLWVLFATQILLGLINGLTIAVRAIDIGAINPQSLALFCWPVLVAVLAAVILQRAYPEMKTDAGLLWPALLAAAALDLLLFPLGLLVIAAGLPDLEAAIAAFLVGPGYLFLLVPLIAIVMWRQATLRGGYASPAARIALPACVMIAFVLADHLLLAGTMPLLSHALIAPLALLGVLDSARGLESQKLGAQELRS